MNDPRTFAIRLLSRNTAETLAWWLLCVAIWSYVLLLYVQALQS